MRRIDLLVLLVLAATLGCNGPLREVQDPVSPQVGLAANVEAANPSPGLPFSAGTGALLATRFESLEALKSVVQIEYFTETDSATPGGSGASLVKLIHQSNGHEVVGILESGISQGDIMEVQKGGMWERLGLIYDSPYAVANRADLQRVFTLSRRRPQWFGEGDAAFFDLAETMVANINTEDVAFKYAKDTTEKGYLNTFNHITAQAFISSFFSEEMADFVADLHERHNMPELITGKFTEAQLTNPEVNPIDNYVDLVNNEWGQELGNQLKEKYAISKETWWTEELLANYLNDIQSYYSWAFQIGFKPFRPDDEVVIRFSSKINLVMRNEYG